MVNAGKHYKQNSSLIHIYHLIKLLYFITSRYHLQFKAVLCLNKIKKECHSFDNKIVVISPCLIFSFITTKDHFLLCFEGVVVFTLLRSRKAQV